FYFSDNATASTLISPLSLHDALPISTPTGMRDHEAAIARSEVGPPSGSGHGGVGLDLRQVCRDRDRPAGRRDPAGVRRAGRPAGDRKSTRLNSSHLGISYAVFCLKTK